MSEIHFENILPCANGHAKLIDECHSSIRSPCFATVKKEKIDFFHPQHENRDRLLK